VPCLAGEVAPGASRARLAPDVPRIRGRELVGSADAWSSFGLQLARSPDARSICRCRLAGASRCAGDLRMATRSIIGCAADLPRTTRSIFWMRTRVAGSIRTPRRRSGRFLPFRSVRARRLPELHLPHQVQHAPGTSSRRREPREGRGTPAPCLRSPGARLTAWRLTRCTCRRQALTIQRIEWIDCLAPHEVYLPDIAGWRLTRVPEQPRERPVRTAPDWVCEILSPSTADRDTGHKPRTCHEAHAPRGNMRGRGPPATDHEREPSGQGRGRVRAPGGHRRAHTVAPDER
jgi:hypothetical protein